MSRPVAAVLAWLASDTWLATATAVVLTIVLGMVSIVLLPFVLVAVRLVDAVNARRDRPVMSRNGRAR